MSAFRAHCLLAVNAISFSFGVIELTGGSGGALNREPAITKYNFVSLKIRKDFSALIGAREGEIAREKQDE